MLDLDKLETHVARHELDKLGRGGSLTDLDTARLLPSSPARVPDLLARLEILERITPKMAGTGSGGDSGDASPDKAA